MVIKKEQLYHTNNSYIPELLEHINPIYSENNRFYHIKDKIKFVDLFAGIGGMRLGFTCEKSKCVFSSEWDKYAQKTYEANFGDKPFGDINQGFLIKILPFSRIPPTAYCCRKNYLVPPSYWEF